MADNMRLNDELNLRALVLEIVDFVRHNHLKNEPDTAEKVLETIFSGIETVDVSSFPFLSDDFTPRKRGPNKSKASGYTHPKIVDLQKVLSGNVTLDKLEQFSKLVSAGAYDELIKKNTGSLVQKIEHCDPSNTFFKNLVELVDPRYFSAQDYIEINNAFEKEDFSSFFLAALRHGLSTLENIPAYYARRIYEQALTFDYDEPARYELMKEAADNGIEQACHEYGNYLAKRVDYAKPLSDEEIPKFEEAIKYFLRASYFDPALWNIGFILQNYNIPKKTVSSINQTLRINSKLKQLDANLVSSQLDIIKPSSSVSVKNRNAVLLAYKIHFYLAFKKDSFAKSLNSLGVMLSNGKVEVDEEASAITVGELIENYRNYAIIHQDVFAIRNAGSAWVKKVLSGDASYEREPKEFLANMKLVIISANAKMSRAIYNRAIAEYYILTKLSEKNRKEINEALKCTIQDTTVQEHLSEALEANSDDPKLAGELYYRLGEMEPHQNESTRAEYYTKAAEKGQADAVYEVSLKQYLYAKDDLFSLEAIRRNLSQVADVPSSKSSEIKKLMAQITEIIEGANLSNQ